jgi:solute carrier family 25 protein 43
VQSLAIGYETFYSLYLTCQQLYQTFSFPFDTIRKKIQAQSFTVTDEMKPDIEFNGMLDAFRQTIRRNGILGLWRGTTANLVKVRPF